jgi:hypothetical protein
MPSVSLLSWQTTRTLALHEIDTQCASSLAISPPNPRLAEENIRGYVVLLSAHFQGFCRDLYTEAAQFLASKVRRTLQVLIQTQFTASLSLDHGNPNLTNLKKDFDRFGGKLDLLSADPANPVRLQDLSKLNEWRNIAAHHGVVPPGGLPSMPAIRSWRNSCDGLTHSLDGIMYNRLRNLLRREPWPP